MCAELWCACGAEVWALNLKVWVWNQEKVWNHGTDTDARKRGFTQTLAAGKNRCLGDRAPVKQDRFAVLAADWLQGASVVLYRNSDYRKYQYFAYSHWPGGLMGSPSMAGTRPGG